MRAWIRGFAAPLLAIGPVAPAMAQLDPIARGLAVSARTSANKVAATDSSLIATTNLINGQLISAYTSLGQQSPATGHYFASSLTFNRFAVMGDVGTDIVPLGQSVSAIRIPRLSVGASTTTVRLRLWTRPLNSPTPDASPFIAGDTLLSTNDYPVQVLGLTPGGTYADVRMLLTASIPASSISGNSLIIDIAGLDVDGNKSLIGIGFVGGQSAGLAQHLRGYVATGNSLFGVSDTTNRLGWGVDSATNRLNAVDPVIGADFILPDKLWLTAGQKLPIYWQNTASKRIDASIYSASLYSLKYMPGSSTGTAPGRAYSAQGVGMMDLDPDRVGSTVGLVIRRRGSADLRYRKTITASVVPWSKTSSPTVLFIGDSLAAQFKAGALSQDLVARGMTPTFIGDIGTSSFNGSNVKGEGRGGKAMADFIYSRVYSASDGNTMRPCEDISYAAYLALPQSSSTASDDTKERRNPFLVSGSGAGYYNGYKWSLTRYLAYTGKATPSHIVISLGTNDLFQLGSATMVSDLQAGIPLMVAEIRAAAPNAYISFITDGVGYAPNTDSYYANHQLMMQTTYAAVTALVTAGDTKLAYIPLGLHEDEQAFGALTVNSTDAYGLQSTISDVGQAGYVHPIDVSILNAAAVLASWIAATS